MLKHRTHRAQDRYRWAFLMRVAHAMKSLERTEATGRNLGVHDAACIMLVTMLITRPDLNSQQVGVDEKTPWSGGLHDEELGRHWGDGAFASWDDGDRRNGHWIDLAGVAWKVMQSHPQRGKLSPTSTKPPLKAILSKEAKALAALVDHPDWTDTQIAEAAGCSRASLYRMKKFVAAKRALEGGRDQLPAGRKHRTTGEVEAWDRDDG